MTNEVTIKTRFWDWFGALLLGAGLIIGLFGNATITYILLFVLVLFFLNSRRVYWKFSIKDIRYVTLWSYKESVVKYGEISSIEYNNPIFTKQAWHFLVIKYNNGSKESKLVLNGYESKWKKVLKFIEKNHSQIAISQELKDAVGWNYLSEEDFMAGKF